VTRSVTFLVSFLATLGYLFIRDWGALAAVATVGMLAMNANGAADGALLRRVGGADATTFRSATHAITNVGIPYAAPATRRCPARMTPRGGHR
jgi:hypothetical protein